jgi:hypothetical protein
MYRMPDEEGARAEATEDTEEGDGNGYRHPREGRTKADLRYFIALPCMLRNCSHAPYGTDENLKFERVFTPKKGLYDSARFQPREPSPTAARPERAQDRSALERL